MKVYLVLLLLLPLCSAGSSTLPDCESRQSAKDFHIQCYGEDFFMVNNLLLDCTSKVQQACYTRDNGEKGCTTLDNCSNPRWTCCHSNGCNK